MASDHMRALYMKSLPILNIKEGGRGRETEMVAGGGRKTYTERKTEHLQPFY